MVQTTVLIVGDLGALGARLRTALEAADYAVLAADNALDAVQMCVQEPVDAVVAQAELNSGGCLSIVQHFRDDAQTRHTPVLVVVQADDAAVRSAMYDAGADDVFGATLSAAEVMARLGRQLKLRQRFDGLARENERLLTLSVTDGLTGTANHRHFQERLKEEFRRAQRYDDPLSLVMLDVDHFKNVNDAYGHQTGDAVLKAVASAVLGAVRETDFVARYGGEEFAVLLPNTHLAGALTVAERVSQDIRANRFGPGDALTVSASFGVSCFPGRSVTSPETLIRTADEAMYKSKRDGRNRISLYHVAMVGTA